MHAGNEAWSSTLTRINSNQLRTTASNSITNLLTRGWRVSASLTAQSTPGAVVICNGRQASIQYSVFSQVMVTMTKLTSMHLILIKKVKKVITIYSFQLYLRTASLDGATTLSLPETHSYRKVINRWLEACNSPINLDSSGYKRPVR